MLKLTSILDSDTLLYFQVGIAAADLDDAALKVVRSAAAVIVR